MPANAGTPGTSPVRPLNPTAPYLQALEFLMQTRLVLPAPVVLASHQLFIQLLAASLQLRHLLFTHLQLALHLALLVRHELNLRWVAGDWAKAKQSEHFQGTASEEGVHLHVGPLCLLGFALPPCNSYPRRPPPCTPTCLVR